LNIKLNPIRIDFILFPKKEKGIMQRSIQPEITVLILAVIVTVGF